MPRPGCRGSRDVSLTLSELSRGAYLGHITAIALGVAPWHPRRGAAVASLSRAKTPIKLARMSSHWQALKLAAHKALKVRRVPFPPHYASARGLAGRFLCYQNITAGMFFVIAYPPNPVSAVPPGNAISMGSDYAGTTFVLSLFLMLMVRASPCWAFS